MYYYCNVSRSGIWFGLPQCSHKFAEKSKSRYFEDENCKDGENVMALMRMENAMDPSQKDIFKTEGLNSDARRHPTILGCASYLLLPLNGRSKCSDLLLLNPSESEFSQNWRTSGPFLTLLRPPACTSPAILIHIGNHFARIAKTHREDTTHTPRYKHSLNVLEYGLLLQFLATFPHIVIFCKLDVSKQKSLVSDFWNFSTVTLKQ